MMVEKQLAASRESLGANGIRRDVVGLLVEAAVEAWCR